MEGKYSPGKPARKFYLSEEAAAMLFAESKRSTYPMSTLVDMAIKKCYGPNRHDEATTLTPERHDEIMQFLTERVRAASPVFPPVEDRKAFVVPDGHYAVRDAEGRATGEVRPLPTPEEANASLERARRPAPPKKDDPFDF